jgi:hypothetical protein
MVKPHFLVLIGFLHGVTTLMASHATPYPTYGELVCRDDRISQRMGKRHVPLNIIQWGAMML